MTRYLYWIATHNGWAVFATEARVRKIEAILNAQTWGEFALLDPGTYAAMGETWEDEGETPPHAEEQFNVSMVPGFDEGDYPPWLQAEMDSCIPVELLHRHGRRGSSVLNGPYWEIPETSMEPLAQDLRAAGHVATYSPGKQFG